MSPSPPQEELADPRPLEISSVGAAWRAFVSHRPPRILVAFTGALLGLRLRMGAPSVWDLAMVAALVAMHPFVEWIIHVYVLHFRPRRLGRQTFDFRVARYHRNHHRDPWDMRWVFMPMPQAAIGLSVQMLIMGAFMPTWPLRLTAWVVQATLGLLYEWVHFLTHTTYRPRTAWYRRVRHYHRLHHFKNERYWYGVSMHLGDLVLQTRPDRTSVPTSKTARNLGLEDDRGEGRGPD